MIPVYDLRYRFLSQIHYAKFYFSFLEKSHFCNLDVTFMSQLKFSILSFLNSNFFAFMGSSEIILE